MGTQFNCRNLQPACRTITAAFVLAIGLLFSLLPFCTTAVSGATVEIFSPQGEAKGVRQIMARFSEEMVSFGDPRPDDPFIVACPVAGKGRWADGKNWIYDFDEDLKSGLSCTFTLKENAATLAGQKIVGKTVFSFSTGGPEVSAIYPGEDSEDVDEHQVFIFTVDGPVKTETVARSVYCYLPSTKERLAVRVLKDDEKQDLIKTVRYDINPKAETVAVQCGRPLPSNFPLDLVWGKGVLSASGAPSGEPRVFHFKTRGPFTAALRCERERAKSDCIPILPVSLRFSAPIDRKVAETITVKEGTKVHRPTFDHSDGSETTEVVFKGPFHEKTALTISVPRLLKDDAGRSLTNVRNFPLTVKVGPYPALAKFSSRFGIIEKSDPVLPVTVRNIEPYLKGKVRSVAAEADLADKTKSLASDVLYRAADATKSVLPEKGQRYLTTVAANVRPVEGDQQIIGWLQKVATVGRSRSLLKGEGKAKALNMPRPLGNKAFEVMGIPFKKTGLYVVELESSVLGLSLLAKNRPAYVHTAALVTNLSAHLKVGRESSLVWVTTLDGARPVVGAKVTLRDSKGDVHWEGTTNNDGIAHINKRLPDSNQMARRDLKTDEDAYYDYSQAESISAMGSGFFAFVHTKDDMTFVHSSWDRGIEPYRFRLPEGAYHEAPFAVHTIFDRTLFRAGETVHMKHLVRKKTMYGLAFYDRQAPQGLTIEHGGSDRKYPVSLSWNKANGVAETVWQIPNDAKLGTYFVYLGSGNEREQVGEFKVQEFKVPLMKGAIKTLMDPLVRAASVNLDLLVEYLSGGGAANLPVRLRAVTQPRATIFDDYEEYRFAAGPVKEGIVSRGEEEGDYDSEYGDDEQGDNELPPRRSGNSGQKVLRAQNVTLGPGGMARTKIDDIPEGNTPVDLVTEMEFMDPNGKVVTVSRTVPVFPSSVLLGIESDYNTSAEDPIRFKVVAVDLTGKPLTGVSVKADIFQKKRYSHRKRLIGGFYAYDQTTEISRLKTICTGKTTSEGLLFCEAKSPVGGEIIIEATATDAAGNPSATQATTYVSGREESWFDVSDSDRIDLIPDKRKYEPGETAVFQARMPMREATALVTIEREGVIDAFVTTLSGKEPLIRVPIKTSYSPNIFVSALCVRGRVSGPAPTAFIDLGKPVFKLGIAGVSVGWQAHELKVAVSSDRRSYRVRDKAVFRVKASTVDGKPLPKGAEAAIAIVDDGLLELRPNQSWNLLEGMMQKRPYSVSTATAQMQVVGRRHYGLKALPFGGGGGKQITRELFDTLLFWKGSVPLDQNGEASIEVPLNDSLTSFSAVAVVTAGADRFGTGRTHITTTQDLMAFSGLPTVVREGDTFGALCTVRNVTDHTVASEIGATLSAGKEVRVLPVQNIPINPGEAREVFWNITVPIGIDSLKWDVSVRDTNGTARDSIKVVQKVVEAVPARVFQATVTQVEKPVSLTVERPKEALPDKGSVKVSLKSSLSGDVSGIAEYMSFYPYTCLEQRVSKAIALQDDALWKNVARIIPGYLDRNGLAKYFPSMDEGSDVLTSYVISVADEAGREIPVTLLEQMQGGLKAFVEGTVKPSSAISRADLTIRKLAAIEALSRSGQAKASYLDSIEIRPNLWPTSAVLDWTSILGRVKDIPNREKRFAEAEQTIRRRLNFQGTHMGFSTERSDELWWLMTNGDVNAVRAVLTFLKEPAWKSDIPRLLRGALGRQKEGRWRTTVANAWGRIALRKFGDAFESSKVTGVTKTAVGNDAQTVNWGENHTGATLSYSWPRRTEPLNVVHEGAGNPWLFVTSSAALPLQKPFSSGYTIKKTYAAVEQKTPGRWTIGDVVRVHLDVEAQSEMTWVVLADPVPAGASILGGGLGRDSKILKSGEEQRGWIWPAFEERSFEAFRAYYGYVPQGKWSVEYTVRLNTTGSFVMPPTRVEALYAPEMLGEVPNAVFRIE
jgi:alpha-2-macroglobulin